MEATTMKKIYLPILILLLFSSISFAQKTKNKTDETITIEKKLGVSAMGDKVSIKDGSTILMKFRLFLLERLCIILRFVSMLLYDRE